MKIAIINGSPKHDKYSSTMSFIRYIRRMYPSHTFEILNVGMKLVRMKIREESFKNLIDVIQNSDGVLWTFPVYTMLIPAQLKRFIELIWENKVENVFATKYTAVLSTSLKFFDHTAHNYMQGICDDLNMKFVGFHSAHIDDLLDINKRRNYYRFFENFFFNISNEIPTTKRYPAITYSNFKYQPTSISPTVDNSQKKVTILTDATDADSNLNKMIETLKNSFVDQTNVKVINLHDINIKGGCLGCIQCGFENKCIYKDDYVTFFRDQIKNQPIMIYAARTTDRFYSHRWKLYFDRIFHNGHTPSLRRSQMGFLISGPLNQIPNLRQLISAQAECGQANLVDVITDESENSAQIDTSIKTLAASLIRLSNMDYVAPPTFLEVGGFKVFRDLIYGIGRIPFPSDYKFFKDNDMFDFPAKDRKLMALGKVTSVLFKSKKIRDKFQKMIGEVMIYQPERMLRKLDVEKEKKYMIQA